MRKLATMARRIAVISGALADTLESLPDQSLKRQLIELAALCECEADELQTLLELDEESPTVRPFRAA